MTTNLGAHPRWGGGGGDDDGAAGRGGVRGRPFSSVGRRARPARVCIILTFQLASPHLVDFHRGGAEPTNLAKLTHTSKLLSIRESKKMPVCSGGPRSGYSMVSIKRPVISNDLV